MSYIIIIFFTIVSSYIALGTIVHLVDEKEFQKYGHKKPQLTKDVKL